MIWAIAAAHSSVSSQTEVAALQQISKRFGQTQALQSIREFRHPADGNTPLTLTLSGNGYSGSMPNATRKRDTML